MFQEVPACFFKAEFPLRITEGTTDKGLRLHGESLTVNQGMTSVDSIRRLQEQALEGRDQISQDGMFMLSRPMVCR